MRISTKNLYVDVPDEEVYKEKGLEGPKSFPVRMGDATIVGSFTLSPMPGCCGIVVSTDSQLHNPYRGTWTGPEFHEIKSKVATYFGYKTMLMTTQLRNFPEVVGASKAKWKFVHCFRNKRTDNDIGIAIKDL
jgi:hypothetical protein